MGHLNHVTGLQINLNNKWLSKWSVDIKNKFIYSQLIAQDLLIQQFILQFFKKIQLQTIKPIIKRTYNGFHIFLGIYFEDSNAFSYPKQQEFQYLIENFVKTKIFIYYIPITTYFYDAQLLSNYIVKEINNNKKPLMVFKNIIKKKEELLTNSLLIQKISGIKYEIAGRIKGVDRARTQKFLWGSVSLNKISQKISYAKNTVFTKEGTLGIKVWIAFNNL